MTVRWRLLLVAGLVGLVVGADREAAVASCAEGSGPDGSPVVFVGTAEAERRGYTRFAVEEVWAGPDLAAEVWVRTGQDQPTWPLSLFAAVGSSNDADLATGDRYVVGAGRSFDTDDCRISAAEDEVLPAESREPVADGTAGADPPLGPLGQTLWVASGLGLVAAVVGLLRRRRRHAPGRSPSRPRHDP